MSLNEFIYFNKKKIIILGLVIIICTVCFLFFWFYEKKEEIKLIESESGDIDIGSDILQSQEEKIDLCYFDIKGEIVNPGVYVIDCNMRINDAIVLSGGLTKNSDTSVLNLSKKIEDGMVIKVYSKKEVSSYLETLENEKNKEIFCINSNPKNDACISENTNIDSNANNTKLININTATLSELMSLSGIGESKARKIIDYRNNQPFTKIEDILNVEGIGESIYDNIKKNITV